MLSIARMVSGQHDYYLGLASEDYYLDGGEPPGRWLGRGAESLGLVGQVHSQDLGNLFRGVSPNDGAPLRQLQAYRGREQQAGWDLTFSAPKSISLLWALGGESLRGNLEVAHRGAVEAAISYLQDEAAWTRRGKGGTETERVGLLAAGFEHGTSRAQDPQLHTHVLALNLGLRGDGSFGALRSRDLYQHKMVAGALYRAELGHRCRELGLELKRERTWFEATAIPEELREVFSKRRQQIVEVAAENGWTNAKDMERLCLSTRSKKGHVARTELFPLWSEVATDLGFGLDEILREGGPTGKVPDLERVTREALRHVGARSSRFTVADVIRGVAQQHAAAGFSSEAIRRAASTEIERSENLVELGGQHGYRTFGTRENVERERRLYAAVKDLDGRAGHLVDEEVLRQVLATRGTIREEQRTALSYITTGTGDLACVSGMAGTGKTYLLAAAREAWEGEGLVVRGAAIAARAARELEQGSSIESLTIAKTLKDLREGNSKLDCRTVLVIDEAGMVATEDMEKIVVAVNAARAKLVLVGDEKQLQPIGLGTPFDEIMQKFGRTELSDIQRQREPWMREAVQQFAAGDARGALAQYAVSGRLALGETRQSAIVKLIKNWSGRRHEGIEDSLILAGTRRDVDELNTAAQCARIAAGELGEQRIRLDGRMYFLGDRVTFTKNDRRMGVFNGDFGTIEAASWAGPLAKPVVTVRLDNEHRSSMTSVGKLGTRWFGSKRQVVQWSDRVTLGAKESDGMQLGYAVTTHKAQGATVEEAHVLAGGWMQDRELSYVQMSRSRGSTWIYASKADAGEDMTELVASMSRSRRADVGRTRSVPLQQSRMKSLGRGSEMER